MSTPCSPARRRLAGLATAAALLVAHGLAGCDLRWETPPPSPLVPDEVETVRQRATAHASALTTLATSAARGADEDVRTQLEQVAAVSTEHLDQLGGLYVDVRPSPTTTPTATPAAADPADVASLLAETAASARADAAAVPEPALGRLLASVATARTLLAERLSATLGEEPPVPDGEPDPVPAAVPAGTSDRQVTALIASEDAAGYLGEVAAARAQGEARAATAARALEHRDRAEAWALLAGVAGTGLDPRRSTYALPDALRGQGGTAQDVAAALASVEDGLAATYASLVAAAGAGERTVYVDGLLDAARTASRLTGGVPAFPGLPEQQG